MASRLPVAARRLHRRVGQHSTNASLPNWTENEVRMPTDNRTDGRQGRDDRVAQAQDPSRNCDLERKVLKKDVPRLG